MDILHMKVLKKSRKYPKPGDIFVLQMVDPEFIFGRVIDCNTNIGNFDDVIMLYIYDARSTCATEIPTLRRDKLLIPPVGTNRQGWLKGYYETVAHVPLTKRDVLKQHCFARLSPLDDRVIGYCDEKSNRLRKRVEPCRSNGLSSYSSIDEEISRALGL